MTSDRTDYEAVNRRGVVLSTFGDLALARKWAREHAADRAATDGGEG